MKKQEKIRSHVHSLLEEDLLLPLMKRDLLPHQGDRHILSHLMHHPGERLRRQHLQGDWHPLLHLHHPKEGPHLQRRPHHLRHLRDWQRSCSLCLQVELRLYNNFSHRGDKYRKYVMYTPVGGVSCRAGANL